MNESEENDHIYGMKVEKLIPETIFSDTPLPDEVPNEAPPEPIEVEPRSFTIEFAICKLLFHGQKRESPSEHVIIHSTSVEEFTDEVFKVVQPFMKRGIHFPEPDNPCWFENEVPIKEHLSVYIQFKDTIQKRTWRLEQVDEYILMRWATRVIYLQVYAHTTNIHSRAMWENVLQELFGLSSDAKKPAVPKEVQEEQRLQYIIKKLQKLHQAYLVPRTDDAFKLWARLILQQPSKKERDYWYDKPPKQLLENFVVIEKETTRKRTNPSVSAQRAQTADGFGFEDEVLALRHTVTQIRDLVEMLDKRVALLEEKCRGFKQTAEGEPVKKGRYDTDDENIEDEDRDGSIIGEEIDEFPIDISPVVKVEGNRGNPDPLIFNDMIEFVKEENDEIESDG
ncbi:uncharacterized protein LOC134227321 [Armigeres subalbatus]|uniref:uncharacterized protein LOC134227321 n=1 Tax=Armigeres subalbatus TaxID=124917 RepID=UPI002ED4B982